MIVLIAALCCVTLCFTGLAAEATKKTAAQGETVQSQILKSYAGNISDNKTKINFVSMAGLFGSRNAYELAEAAKFKSPKAGWTLHGVNVIGWDGFNGTLESIPIGQIFALEIRDKNLNLLYQFADLQIPYTNFVFNMTRASGVIIDLPPIAVSDEFYVCLFDRGGFVVGAERANKTGDSYFFNKATGEMIPAVLPVAQNQTAPINWIMEVIGS
jgi:hypothetical protein